MNLSLSLVKTTYLEGKEAKNAKNLLFFVFSCMLILISQESDERAIASSLNTICWPPAVNHSKSRESR